MCPSCGTVLRARQQNQPGPISKPQRAAPPARRGRAVAPDLKNLNVDEDEYFTPALPDAPKPPMDPLIFYLYVGAGAVILIFGVYVALLSVMHGAAKPVQPAPPPSAITYNIAPNPEPPPPVIPKPPPAPVPVVIHKQISPPLIIGPAWARLQPTHSPPQPVPINDQMVETSIEQGVKFLESQYKDGLLTTHEMNDETNKGADALGVYALLHAGEAIDNSDLEVSSPFIAGLLDHLKDLEMVKELATYQRSLRAQAMGLANRASDRDQLNKDKQWLMKSEIGGAYGYSMPDAKATPENFVYDHSNSQYGVLGMWAAENAGQSVPEKYWDDVEQHWLLNQDEDGGWGYRQKGGGSSLTMTCAGVTTLCLCADEKISVTIRTRRGAVLPKFSDAVNKAIAYLGKDDHIHNFGGHDGYALYGIERAALATGYRWFGAHDWFRELGAEQLKLQQKDGSWGGGDYRPVETAFRLLFLSRGRQPLMMDKLRFDGDWNDRPRDVAKIVQFASAQLEKPFAWGVADLDRDWWDWLESPLLMISTDTPPVFSDEQCSKLRSYTDAGGMIFIHNEFGSHQVDAFVNALCQRLYPQYPLKKLAPDDMVYSSVFPMKTLPVLEGVSNGTRTLLIYSPADLTQQWIRWQSRDNKDNPSMQLGLNLFVDAAGKIDFRNRLNSPYIGPIQQPPIGKLPVYQVSYPGRWNPEPGAWLRFPRWFQQETGIEMAVQSVDIKAMDPKGAPVALLTGNTLVNFAKVDTHALREYVEKGGVVMIDSTGGSKEFARSIREGLLPLAFPGIHFSGIPGDHPILNGKGPCADALPKPHLRNYTFTLLNGVAPSVQFASIGKGAVIISDLDITTGLLNSGTYATFGYTPAYCQSLVKNILLWTISRYHP